MPPLDTPATAAVSGAGGRPLVWVERVHGAPVGEFFVVRELVDRHLTVRDVRRYTPEVDAQVRSRVRWAELLVMGRRGIVGWAAPRLEWRGSERDVWLVRDSVRAVQQSMDESAHDRRARYEVLGDAVGLLRDLGRVLRVEASHTGLW